MKMVFCFLAEMSDYNKKLRIFYPQFMMRNVLLKHVVMEFKLTKIDKFIRVIWLLWLLHNTYLEKILRNIVCMHIKSSMS
jgi:hypothetical protein